MKEEITVKNKTSKQLLSVLLALVMILGLLPVAAYASDYIKLGEIKAVTVQSKDLAVPVVGERKYIPRYTLTSPTDENVRLMECGWQKYNAYYDTWENYFMTKFEKGTYRLQLLVTTMCSEDSRTYYALLNNTTLTVNGTRWTAEWMDDQYEATGYGEILFSSPGMEALPTFTVTDSCQQCSVVPVSGEMTVLKGNDFSFTLKPRDYYELTDPDGLMVFANDRWVTPNKNGVYTVKNATEDLEIYTVGSSFTAFADLTITANGVTVKDKVYAGQSYTLKTVEDYGAAVPEQSVFTHWKVSGLGKYQPGQSFTVNGGGAIRIEAVFSGLYNITVNNGKAYADEAHTQPLTVAKDEQKVYIVADEAPEGMTFAYWDWEADPGHYTISWFYDITAPSTWFTVDSGDIVLTPVYEHLVDSVTIHGVAKPVAGVTLKENENTWHNWGESVPENAGYTFNYAYWYDTTSGEPVPMKDGDVFQNGHSYRYDARINVWRDYTFPDRIEDLSVNLTGIDPEEYQLTLSVSSSGYLSVVAEFACEGEEPVSSYERPVGYGTKSDPFRISTASELYWFAAFVNGKLTAPDLTLEPETACAILMNDITVNPNLLHTDGTLIGAPGFERWTPIGYGSKYTGTFEGQGHAVKGLYFDHGISYTKHRDIGFIANLDNGGCVRNLTVADSWFATPSANTDFYLGGIAGYVGDATVTGCFFQGVIKANTDHFLNSVGGIAGVSNGTIDDCWVMGWIKAYSTYGAGGIVGSARGTVKNSINYAQVINTLPALSEGGYYSGTGGIVGILRQGVVADCRNIGIIGGKHFVGGIAGQACGTQSQPALINRCSNEGDVGGSGIVGRLGDGTLSSAAADGYATVQNCYNKGSVLYGICEYANGSGNEVSYCHNVGIATQQPILGGAAADSDIVIKRCYYQAGSEMDSIVGTAYKTATEFADGTVLSLMDNGNWKQWKDHPILGQVKAVRFNVKLKTFGSDADDVMVQLIAEGSETAAYTATVKGNTDGYSFEGVTPGTYTMTVSMVNHVTRTYTVTVGDSSQDQDVKLHLLGDVTGDGKLNIGDAAKVYSHVKGTASLTDDYILACADASCEGRVNIGDVAKIYGHVKGTAQLW